MQDHKQEPQRLQCFPVRLGRPARKVPAVFRHHAQGFPVFGIFCAHPVRKLCVSMHEGNCAIQHQQYAFIEFAPLILVQIEA